MHDTPAERLSPLLRKLSSLGAISKSETDAVFALPVTIRDMRPEQDLVRQGDRPSQTCVMLAGMSYRFKIVGDGAKQIFSYHISGDLPDLQSLYLVSMDHTLCTLTRSTVAFVPHRALHNLIDTHPRLAGLLWRDTLIDGSIVREWMCSIGRRSAKSRIAHLICELFVRYRNLGLAEGMTIPFALTQVNLGDSLGLSVVHVNRVVRKLKQDQLIAIEGRRLTVLHWDALVRTGDFDPDYLHLAPREAETISSRRGSPSDDSQYGAAK
jgi:CRP-like cAMP-binding protein